MVSVQKPREDRRYEQFRDDSGSWTFDIQEYRADINSIDHVDISAEPCSDEAYRAAVFLEGFINEMKAESNWNDSAIKRFDAFDSPAEVEAVALALREIADRAED